MEHEGLLLEGHVMQPVADAGDVRLERKTEGSAARGRPLGGVGGTPGSVAVFEARGGLDGHLYPSLVLEVGLLHVVEVGQQEVVVGPRELSAEPR